MPDNGATQGELMKATWMVDKDVKAGLIAQHTTRRGFPRVWRRYVSGIAQCEQGAVPIGIVTKDTTRGSMVEVVISGVFSMPPPTPLTRWDRFVRWLWRFRLSA